MRRNITEDRKSFMNPGKPIVIEVQSERMYADGYKFYLPTSRVCLGENVTPEYLRFPEVKWRACMGHHCFMKAYGLDDGRKSN
jgi:RNA:NAD 2'-phosphotransferase (TPT1/KptA family)